MILKRQEKENVVKALYDSSNIIASAWNKERNELILTFNKGTRYKYPNVSSTDYLRFETADSQGSVLNTHLKKMERKNGLHNFYLRKKVINIFLHGY